MGLSKIISKLVNLKSLRLSSLVCCIDNYENKLVITILVKFCTDQKAIDGKASLSHKLIKNECTEFLKTCFEACRDLSEIVPKH